MVKERLTFNNVTPGKMDQYIIDLCVLDFILLPYFKQFQTISNEKRLRNYASQTIRKYMQVLAFSGQTVPKRNLKKFMTFLKGRRKKLAPELPKLIGKKNYAKAALYVSKRLFREDDEEMLSWYNNPVCLNLWCSCVFFLLRWESRDGPIPKSHWLAQASSDIMGILENKVKASSRKKKSNTLNIWSCNPGTLKGGNEDFERLQEILHLVRENNVDVIGIQETRIREHDKAPKLPSGFTLYNRGRSTDDPNRKSIGGGVAWIISNHLVHNIVDPDLGPELLFMEHIWIEVQVKKGTSILMGCLYWPPDLKANDLQQDNGVLIQWLSNQTHKTIVLCGDLNAPWHSRVAHWRILETLMRETALVICNDNLFKTYEEVSADNTTSLLPTHGKRCLDYMLVKGDVGEKAAFSKFEPILDNGHCTLGLSLKISKLCRPEFIEKPRWEKMSTEDKEKFDDYISNRVICSKPTSLEEKVSSLSRAMMAAQEMFVPTTTLKSTKKFFAWWSSDLDLLYDKIRRLRRDCRKYVKKLSFTSNVLKKLQWRKELMKRRQLFKEHQTNLRRIMRKKYRESWLQTMDKCSVPNATGYQEMWKLLNRIKSPSNLAAYKPTDAVDHWSSLLSHRKLPNEDALQTELDNWLHSTSEDTGCDFLSKISIQELDRAIHSVPLKKASGCDLVANEAIKTLGLKSRDTLLDIFNQCVEDRCWPEQWKIGRIFLLHKKGAKGDVRNYRPITLLCHLRKILEIIIWERMKTWSEMVIGPIQAGFRPERGCCEQVLVLQHAIDMAKRSRRICWCVFVDFKNAYDSVSHLGLLWKLKEHGLSRNMVEFFRSFLVNQQGMIANDPTNATFPVARGVPQGSVLSPFLFNIFINDLVKSDTISSLGINLGTEHGKIGALFYADDSALISTSQPNAQRQLDVVSNWSKEWGMSIHPQKTVVMTFGKKKDPPALTLDGEQLSFVEEFRYLGVIFASNGASPNTSILEKLESQKQALYLLLRKNNAFSSTMKARVYQSVLRPIALYGCEVREVTGEELEKFQKRMGRGILETFTQCRTKLVYNTLGWWSFNTQVDFRLLNFAERMFVSKYELARQCAFVQLKHGLSWGKRVLTLWDSLNFGQSLDTDLEAISLYADQLEPSKSKIVSFRRDSVRNLIALRELNDRVDFGKSELLWRKGGGYLKETPTNILRYGRHLTPVGFLWVIETLTPYGITDPACWVCGLQGGDTLDHLVFFCQGPRNEGKVKFLKAQLQVQLASQRICGSTSLEALKFHFLQPSLREDETLRKEYARLLSGAKVLYRERGKKLRVSIPAKGR